MAKGLFRHEHPVQDRGCDVGRCRDKVQFNAMGITTTMGKPAV